MLFRSLASLSPIARLPLWSSCFSNLLSDDFDGGLQVHGSFSHWLHSHAFQFSCFLPAENLSRIDKVPLCSQSHFLYAVFS